MVYVDALREYPAALIKRAARHHGRRWCHLTADTTDELHTFALRLGLKLASFQDDHRHPHYDLTPAKRALALKLGAVPHGSVTEKSYG